jgi:SAM-dependent methyltransferase
MSEKYFITSFGKRIDFIPGYREAHARPWNFSTIPGPVQSKKRPGFHDTFEDMFSYGMMVDFLTRLGLWTGRKYRRALDIGGAQGIISALLRGEGRAGHVTTIDIVDSSKSFSPGRHFLYYLKYKVDILVSKYLPVPPKWHIFRKNNNKYGYGTSFLSSVWNVKLRRVPKVDRYVVGDFAGYDFPDKFDLITAMNVIVWLNYDKLFSKISELLEEGGVFFFLTDYWWYPVNSTKIYGDFPYACQRLTQKDLRRYFEENYPDQAENMEKKYSFFHENYAHPVVGDYVQCAEKYGLTLAGSQRLFPKPYSRDNRSLFVPEELNHYDDGRLLEVLEDIHQFRPDVTLEDLYTVHVLMAFVKQPKVKGSLARAWKK